MADIWFTSDTHFFHKTITWIGRGRPWETVDEMNDALVYNWNQSVQKSDRIYHLGDFSFGNREQTDQIIGRLNGQIHVIRGNHDSGLDRFASRFVSYQQYKEIKVDGQRLVLFHYPIHSWHQVGKGSFHLHGHCHGLLPDSLDRPRCDVGVDAWGFAPVNYETIRERLLPLVGWRPGDHH